ncbi:hypothetical protein V500_07829 [Pseudogymnoascus sp. VKM F-4518 (FW-2643)]|nr:hypothetical protein V500_07829 [Pseudogymnoascus sp. VKM F-4518 (FW-2643)]
MRRTARPPSRVSKACDRCRSHKKRSPKLQAELAPRKPRLRSHADAVVASQTVGGRRTSSYPHAAERQSVSSYRSSDSAHDESEETGQAEVSWDTPNATNAGDNYGPLRQNPRKRGSSHLSDFDADSALAITRKIFGSQKSRAFTHRATSAIPGGGCRDTSGTRSSNNVLAPLVPVVEIIGIELPSYAVCNKLLETYFSAVHWFSLVVYEPKFRGRYNEIVQSGLASRSDHGFLLLLLMVLTMGCWYTPKSSDLCLSGNDMEAIRSQFLKVVQRDFMELMDEDCLEFVQLCALLGSFYLYHGRPRSSFSILGAATKTAQAMDLHRDSETRWTFEDREERKRVWWTVYTWDRFATITYGRPLSINDRDCNVQTPSVILENVHFDPHLQETQICLSTYQCQLNQVYRIASPLLEDIYGMRTSHNMDRCSQQKMVAEANQALLKWQQDLPPHLSFDRLNDLTAYSLTEEKMHSLQALSLQLTYDNLMIVLHRPLLAGRGSLERSAAPEATSPISPFSDDMRDISFKRCLRSALRISNIQQKPILFSLARTTHLVSFLGMNLFTASVVLFICALSDTLSDTAQEAKRGLKRTLQMQKSLSKHASLSMQCTTILEDLVQLILRKEMEEMLLDHSTSDDNGLAGSATRDEELRNAGMNEEVAPNGSGSHAEMHPAEFDITSQEAAPPEGSNFNQSLRTLQKVFYDSSLLRHQGDADSDLGARKDYGNYATTEHSLNPEGMIGSQDIGFNDGGFTGVEDLGQFWLWNLEDFNY